MIRRKQKQEDARSSSGRQMMTARTTSNRNANAGVFSYHSKRSQSEVSRPRNDIFDQETKVKNKNLVYAPSILAAILIIVSFIYMSILDTTPRIMPLGQQSNSMLRDAEYYQKTIAGILDDSISNRFKLTIDTKKVENDILKALPELDKVSVNIPIIGRRPIVQISPTIPSLIVTNNDSYVVGINGKILMKLSELPDNQRKGLTRVNDAIGLDATVGDTILPIDTISFIYDVIYQFKQRNIEIESIELPAVANELHVRPKGSGYIVRYDLQSDSREQSGRYFAIIDSIKNGSVPDVQQYIDVRVDGRAYLK